MGLGNIRVLKKIMFMKGFGKMGKRKEKER